MFFWAPVISGRNINHELTEAGTLTTHLWNCFINILLLLCAVHTFTTLLQISQWSRRYGEKLDAYHATMNTTLVCGRYNPFLSLFLRCGCLSVWGLGQPLRQTLSPQFHALLSMDCTGSLPHFTYTNKHPTFIS